MNLRNFFAELKRRNVYKVAIAYAVAAWLLMQIATQVFPFLEIPNWAIRLVIILPVIGFPIALVIAWAFELTPQGLKTDRSSRCDFGTATSRESRLDCSSCHWGRVLYRFISGRPLYRFETGNAFAFPGKIDRCVAF